VYAWIIFGGDISLENVKKMRIKAFIEGCLLHQISKEMLSRAYVKSRHR
jgi:hypothetical protein